MPWMVRFGKAWFRRNHTYRVWALRGLWGAALLTIFLTIGFGVDMPVGTAGAMYWTAGMGLSMLLLWGWFVFNSRVCALVPMAASDVGGHVIRSFEWTAQSWRLSWWDLVWLRCMPTPEQWAQSRSVVLDAKLPEVSVSSSPSRPRF